MKKRASIRVAILLLAVGFAAISTTLIINGNTKVGENTDDFSVIFTAASLDGTDVYKNVISEDKKTITFETSDLKTLNQTSVLNYEVTNNSANYDAEVTVNCKVKDDAVTKYTSIKNELEGNATKVLAKETLNGTLTVTLNKTATEEVKEQYICELTFNAVERDSIGSKSVSFASDSWNTIAANVRSNDTINYNVGDTKEVDLGDLGTHTVRIANKSECTNGETSETACGFVIEFADIVTTQSFNGTGTNVGGWRNSAIREYINGTLYNTLSTELQNVIVSTKVISGHGPTNGETNFETQDKLYLLSNEEVYGDFASSKRASTDTALGTSKLLDYYKNKGTTISSYASAIKQYNGNDYYWWLRTAYSDVSFFTSVNDNGNWSIGEAADSSIGVSPAFRIA